jgi:CHAD domain-containing protein
VKARRVKGLDPDASFRVNAEKMALVRIDEVWKLGERSVDPTAVTALHDLRIATKRLRYLMEITEPCFGAPARKATKIARSLQDLLGDIHDCDVMSERVRARALATALDDPRYVGLEALASYMEARRRVLHRQYVTFWIDLERKGYRRRLEQSLVETL